MIRSPVGVSLTEFSSAFAQMATLNGIANVIVAMVATITIPVKVAGCTLTDSAEPTKVEYRIRLVATSVKLLQTRRRSAPYLH
jgi:hypothetical protein